MSTRSFIARQTETGYEGVYCHWDGYPSHNGALLHAHYTDAHKIAFLLSFGDISSLGSNIGEVHDFLDRSDEHATTFYGRDRGECGEHTFPTKFALLRDVRQRAAQMGCEYIYLFKNEAWSYCERRPQFFGVDNGAKFSRFIPLVDVVPLKT